MGLPGDNAPEDERIEKLKAGIAAIEAKAAAITDQAGTDNEVELPPATLEDDAVALELNRDAQASIDNFAATDVGESSGESVTGKFDSRGLNFGSGARRIEPLGNQQPAEKLEPVKLDNEPEVIAAPLLAIEEPEPEADPRVAIDEPSIVAEPMAEPFPADNIESGLQQLNDRLVSIGQYLMKSNELLAGGSGNLDQTGERSGFGLSEDVQRAIVETAHNTRKLAERSSGGGLVFS